MFAMHRKTRILLCRIAFIGLCVLPTTVVAGWIVTRATTGNAVALKAEWERELTSRIGLVASIGEVSYPCPQIARLQSVKLLDPETQHLVAEAAVVEIEKEAAGWMVDAAGLSIVASELAALRRVARPPAAAWTIAARDPLAAACCDDSPRSVWSDTRAIGRNAALRFRW